MGLHYISFEVRDRYEIEKRTCGKLEVRETVGKPGSNTAELESKAAWHEKTPKFCIAFTFPLTTTPPP